MAITNTQAVSANAASVAITSTAANDLIICFAYNTTATIPSLPAGFTNIAGTAGTQQAARCGRKLSAGGDTSSGTWTNATQIVCLVYSGINTLTPIGSVTAIVPGNSTVANCGTIGPPLVMGGTIVGFTGAKNATSGMTVAPAGTTLRTNVTTVNGWDYVNNISTTTISGINQGFSPSSRWQSIAVELRGVVANTSNLTATFSPTGTIAKRSKVGGYVASLSFAGNFIKGRKFFSGFTANLLGGGALVFTDDFNRADGGLGASWTTDSFFTALAIVSNTCRGSTGGAHNVAIYNANGIVAADQYAQFKVTTVGDFVGPVLRSNGAGTFYTCYYPPTLGNAATIYKWISGSATLVNGGSTSVTPTVDDVIYFEAVGSALTMKVNGVTVCTGTDSDITGAGYTGIDIYQNTVAVDNFVGGTFSGGAAVATLARIPNKVLVATLSLTGIFRRNITKGLVAALSFVGTLLRNNRRRFSSVLSFVGLNSTIHLIVRSVNATLSFVGSLATQLTTSTQQHLKSLSGTLSFVGNYVKISARNFTGTLTFVVVFTHTFTKVFTATLTFVGAVRRSLSRRLVGVLSFIGNFSSVFSHLSLNLLSVSANLGFVGTVRRLNRHSLTSTLSFVGTFGKRMVRNFVATLFLHE